MKSIKRFIDSGTMGSIFILLMFLLLGVVALTGEHRSFSGSKKYLETIGSLRQYGNKIVYIDTDSVLTKREQNCLIKLGEKYQVEVYYLNENLTKSEK